MIVGILSGQRGAARALGGAALLALMGCGPGVVWYGKSPDRGRAAVVLQDGDGQRVRVNGRDGPRFLGIGVEAMAWSPDGRRLAYPARTAEGWVVGDRDLLRRAATNLVKNASEALHGRGGIVRVRVRSSDSRAALEVLDDGPGIPPELTATLARPGVTGKPGGSGLGLAMVERIAAEHHGTLTWTSGPAGSVFTLEFPKDAPAG
jgi:signal transduction histidine kinase